MSARAINRSVVFRLYDGRSRRATFLRGMGQRGFHKARGFEWALQMHWSYSRTGRVRGRGNQSPRTSVAKVLRMSRFQHLCLSLNPGATNPEPGGIRSRSLAARASWSARRHGIRVSAQH